MIRYFLKYASVMCFFGFSSLFAQKSEQFSDVEIRVIRQKEFQKSLRLETSFHLNVMMSQAFLYTYLGNAQIAFHISESIGVFGEFGGGFSFNKADTSDLADSFSIEPEIEELQMWYGGGLVLTPAYGKYQLDSGNVIYFDWFFFAGAGMTNMAPRRVLKVEETPLEEGEVEKVAYSGSQITFGTGQRYSLMDRVSVNWNLRGIMLGKDFGSLFSELNTQVMVSVGVSYFLF